MDKQANTKSTISSGMKYEHLKPLSVYSRMIYFDQSASLHQFPNPFINFKIKVFNNCEKKRKLDDSCPDEGYVTPAKKAFSPMTLSPDLGCFMDYCSPPARKDSVSPPATSKPALLKNTQGVKSETKQTVSSQLLSKHLESGSSAEPGDNEGTVPNSVMCDKVLLNFAPDFDCDVDAILCLNPIGSSNAGIFSDNAEISKSLGSNTFENKPVLIHTVAHGQQLDRGDGQVKEEQEELKTDMNQNVKDVEEDMAYFSMSYIKDLKTGKDPSHAVHPQLSPATSGALLRISAVEVPEDECRPESSSEPGHHKQALLSRQQVSFGLSDLCPIVSGPLLESVKSPVEHLEGDAEDVWNIGLPVFESSVCHVTVKWNAGSEQSREESEELHGGLMEPLHECQAALGGEEATVDISHETTLPLQVQVKSVVVVPHQHTSGSKLAAAKSKVYQSAKCVPAARSRRSGMFNSEKDLERAKRLYLHSVRIHINGESGTAEDAMSELQNLMNHVADQTPGTNGRQWQHPSDLTRRNYQRRFTNMPTMALHEWQAKNCKTYKRFANIPKIFQRSPFP